MADLTPRTRSESFLNGEDLEPITRREHFYAGRENELPEGHQEPETREEWFIQKYREAGDVTVESLSITENGTYTAPSGKAYSPVSVNVPLPSNAYLLKSIEHEQVATFADGTDNFLKSLEVAIEPQQDLHGYDSPWAGGAGKNKMPLITLSTQTKNGITFTPVYNGDSLVRIDVKGEKTISGSIWYGISEATITISQNMIMNGTQSGSNVRITAFRASVGSGDYVDSGNGVEIPTSAEQIVEIDIRIDGNAGTQIDTSVYPMLRYATIADDSYAPYSNICPISGWDEVNVTVADDLENPTVSNVYTIDLDGTRYGGKLDVISGVLTLTDGFISSYNGETLPSSWISDRDVYAEGATPTTGAEVCYKLATPQTIQLTPTIIKSLQGANNFFASTGEVIKLQYWGEVM